CQPIAANSVADQQPRRALDLGLRRQERLLERRRIRNGSVERADHTNGRVERLEGLLLDDRGEALADAAGARVLVDDKDPAAVPRYGEERLLVERREPSQVEH